MADVRRQDGRGRARNRARARLNWFSQGQRWGRCKVRRRAERVSRPAIEKKRRRRVLVVTSCSPRPMRAVQREVMRHHLDGQPGGVGGETPRGEMVEADAVLELSRIFCPPKSPRNPTNDGFRRPRVPALPGLATPRTRLPDQNRPLVR